MGFGQKALRRRERACPLPTERLDLNLGHAPPEAGLPSPSSLRDATSPKVRGFGYTGKFAFSKKLSLWESWREAPERASPLAGRLRPGLDGAYDGADFRKLHLNLRGAFLSAGLPSPSSLTRCHLSQSERPWQSAKSPGLYFTPCCRKGSRRRCAETFRLCQGLPLWGSWQSRQALTERASPLAGTLRLCLALRKIRQKRARSRRGFTSV